ncbi:MAG: ROK family transcriptional regulator, partial [Anaerolineae bacterium]|nr:ROK family transcriptional regulator [Anaerolineae bacterium]
MRRLLRGSSGSVIKSHNLRAVLLTLLRNDGISRVRLAELTQLSNTTITNLINELLRYGVVAEDGRRRPRLRRGAGRPQTALRLVPESRLAVAVHFDVDQVNVAVTNLRAQPLVTLSAEHPPDRPLEVALADTARLVRQAIDQSGVSLERIVGVGVGASGLVDQERGMNVVAPNLGWRDVPLRDWLSAKLRMPVSVENNVRAMALGEVLFGSGQNSHALAFVYARVGVGAGFVVGGEIYRGSG